MPTDALGLALTALVGLITVFGAGIAVIRLQMNIGGRKLERLGSKLDGLTDAVSSLDRNLAKSNDLHVQTQRQLEQAINTSVDEHHKTQALVERLKPQ